MPTQLKLEQDKLLMYGTYLLRSHYWLKKSLMRKSEDIKKIVKEAELYRKSVYNFLQKAGCSQVDSSILSLPPVLYFRPFEEEMILDDIYTILMRSYETLRNYDLAKIQTKDNEIHSIILCERDPASSFIEYVINGDFSGIKRAKWDELYQLARDSFFDFDHADEAKKFKDYFNSSKDNPLWANKKYRRKPILRIESKIRIKVVDDVSLEIYTHNKWSRRIKDHLS